MRISYRPRTRPKEQDEMSETLYRREKCYRCDGTGFVNGTKTVGYTVTGTRLVAERERCDCDSGYIYEPVAQGEKS